MQLIKQQNRYYHYLTVTILLQAMHNYYTFKRAVRTLLLILFVVAVSNGYAQERSYIVRMKQGVLNTGKKLARSSFSKKNIASALQVDRYYLLLQFDSMLSSSKISMLQKQGVRLEDYISDNAYLFSLDSTFDITTLQKAGLLTLNVLPKKYKIDPVVYNPLPIAEKGIEKYIAVHYFRSIDKEMLTRDLQRLGAMIMNPKIVAPGVIFIAADRSLTDAIAALPYVKYINLQQIGDKALNNNSAAAHGISFLNSETGKNLNGQGITVGVGDNSEISNHIDFVGRLISRSPWVEQNHGTHTSGTVAGGGIVNVKYKGMAPKATIINQYFSDIITNAPVYYTDNRMIVTNNSYYSADAGCTGNGEYDVLSAYADKQLCEQDKLLHVVAAGNDGDYTCSPYPARFATVKTGWQCSKNVLTVGAIRNQDYTIASFSSRGPVDDGRLKPEICAGGWSVTSTLPGNTYGAANGTSMAAPAVTGALALMYQRYRQLNGGNDPKSGLMKAIICNTAEDMGNAGPDFTYGFGMMNARKAVDVIDSARYFIGQLSSGQNTQYTINIPAGTSRLKVMLYWHDKEAPLLASQALVNDLDLKVITPSAAQNLPLVLNASPANVNNPAVQGADHLNNIEQVVVANPSAGTYTIDVSAYAIPLGSQEFFVTYEFLPASLTLEYPTGGQTFVPGEQETIRWTAIGAGGNTYKVEYSVNNGNNWSLLSTTVPATQRYYNWTIPSTVSDSVLVRVTENVTLVSSTSQTRSTIIGQPVVTATNLCEGYVQLKWNAIAGATAYDVMMLDKDSMKVVTTVTDTVYIASALDKYTIYWFGVRAKKASSVGRRSVSASIVPNGGGCTNSLFNNDLKVDSIISPVTARQYFSNAGQATGLVSITLKNLGTTEVIGPVTVAYSYEGGSGTGIINANIPPSTTIAYTFQIPFTYDPNGFHYHFKAWVTHASDPSHANDTAYKTVSLLANPPLTTLPYVQGFETANDASYRKAMGIDGIDAVDFSASSSIGRMRTYVNTGFARTGNRALTFDQSPNSTNINADTATITYNLQNFVNSQLRFDFYYKNHGQSLGDANKVWIRGSENDPWINAYDLYANQADLGLWKLGHVNINDVLHSLSTAQNVSPTFQVRFGQEGYTSANSPYPDVDIDDGYTFDDLVIKEVFNDIGVVDIISPDNNGCNLSAANPVQIRLKNYNNLALNNIEVGYQINNNTPVIENLNSISANQSVNYTFSQTADFSAYTDYTVKVWVKYSGDTYPENDTMVIDLRRSPVITTYPYLERFENSDGYYYTRGKNSTWAWGAPAKIIINKAANGQKAWVTSLNGKYKNNEQSYLYSPCFDLSGLTQPVLSFAHIFDIEEDYDYTWVEYSTDGVVWQKLGAAGQGTNWYDNSTLNKWRNSKTRWHVASIDLPVTGQVIRFRFVLSSDVGVTQEGIGIDDIHIFDKAPVYASTTKKVSIAQVNKGDWVHFTSGVNRFASVYSAKNDLGATTVTVYPTPIYYKAANGKYYLGRNWVLNTEKGITDSVMVRFYFTDDEVNTLLGTPACSTCAEPNDAFELGAINFSGKIQNGSLQDNYTGFYKVYVPDTVDIIPYDNGYYATLYVAKEGEYWLGKSDTTLTLVTACSGSTKMFTATPGFGTYQWQVSSNGVDFTNIDNGADYLGVTDDTLYIYNLGLQHNDLQYRCVVAGWPDHPRVVHRGNQWIGVADTNWFNTANWSCGSIPDATTDVIIPAGVPNFPVVNAAVTIRSIVVQPNANITVNNGVGFTLTGQ